ncbi:MAG: hypothetical protein JWN17_3090 [Frankiales bacterium]|nr:hypothetical protein [Frankiales bacterium]
MRSVPLDGLPVVGALHEEHTDTGVAFERLPRRTRAQVADPSLQLVLAMPAGVRLAFTSASTVLELDLAATAVQVGDLPYVRPAVDVVVAGEPVLSVEVVEHAVLQLRGPLPEDVVVLPGGPGTVRLALPGDDRRVEVWFPHGAVTELRGVRVDEGKDLRPVPPEGLRWVHHGSSISHCLEASSPTQTWPALVAREQGLDLLDLALAGQCQLDGWTARAIRDAPADLISLKLGINVVNGDTMRERTFHAAVHGFLDTVRDGHPDTPLLVVTPIVCPAVEQHPGPTALQDGVFGVVPRPDALATGALTLQRVREVLSEVVTARQAADPALHLLDGLQLFGPADVDSLPDGLHPDAAGYRTMAERFSTLVFGGSGAFRPRAGTATRPGPASLRS